MNLSALVRLTFLLTTCAVSGCASQIPPEIRQAPVGNPGLADVKSVVKRFIGTDIRWGGEIVSVENNEQDTWVEIVARDLYDSGRPRESDYSPGRFIAIIPGFLDPGVYKTGREVTVNGVIEDSVTRPIGSFAYQYPLVSVRQHLLWEPLPPRHYYPYPHYWYDSWYHPWYDPWRRHHHWRYPHRYRRY